MSELATKAIQEQLFRHFTRFEASALRTLVEIAGHPNPSSLRRDEAIFYLVEQLSTKAALRKLWERLSPLTQQTLSLTVHVTNGVYQPEIVRLRYGQAPPPPQRLWSGYRPTELDLFMDDSLTILGELYPLLRVVVPKPEPWRIPTQPEPPPRYEALGFERSPGPEVGLQDLLTVLALAGQGRLQINDRMLPTADSIQLILENLAAGDFLLPKGSNPGTPAELNESIRPIGLVRFLLGSGMAAPGPRAGYNQVLELKPLGWEWLARPSADLLLDALETWSRCNDFDELDRLPHLRGAAAVALQATPARKGDGPRPEPGKRRDRILEALSWVPQGVWLSIDDFFKAIKLWQFDFSLDREEELTAIDDSNGRKLDIAELRDPWRATRGAYTLVVLWETLATLGAIDIAYTEPHHAPPFLETPTESWQRPIHPYSRYDGLRYFRVNDLGAYLFGHTKRYLIPNSCTEPFFYIDEERRLHPTRDALLPYQQQILPILGTWDPENACYRLHKAAWLTAQQEQGTLKERRELLQARHDGPLAPAVEDWLEQTEADSTALRRGRTMLTIQVRSTEVRDAILADPELRRYSRLLDDRTLLIPSSREHAFLRRVMELGYGVVGAGTGNGR